MTDPGFASPKAIARFRLLQPHLEQSIPLTHIAAECGVAERTLRRWLAAWRVNGIQGLERTRRSDAGQARKQLGFAGQNIRVGAWHFHI